MPQTAERPLWLRLLWFVGLWAAGVAALGVVAGALRLLIHP
ncbi:hypothetical protein Amal_02112 [Acetobacter malorum]|uniref:DUF2474 domain-containing protein n=1 Tax=Acetobacter malorum TaxID=178901 RepID=A0A177G7T4_9PROT|nr:DUF2474 family protein [Acetobacter malorum]OAG76339.1 hypothetical protein Amal_02112 [Acetobacter malorum]